MLSTQLVLRVLILSRVQLGNNAAHSQATSSLINQMINIICTDMPKSQIVFKMHYSHINNANLDRATNNLGILLKFGDHTVMFFSFIHHVDGVTAHVAKPTPFLKNQAVT